MKCPVESKTVLIVDDECDMCTLLQSILKTMGYHSTAVNTGAAALDYVRRCPPPAAVLLDLNLPVMDGLETLRRMLEVAPQLRVVIISCMNEADRIVAAVKLGAVEYLVKPFPQAALGRALTKCVEDNPAARESNTALGPLPFLCESPAMQALRDNALRVAPTDVPVLILGESGVGKEVVARFLHYSSRRAGQSFIKVNCAALPSDLLESELFGYEKGAFTGATGPKPGKFELANGGTLFLDEIGEMNPYLQAKLLHVLQDGRYFRLGATAPTFVNVRIIAATNVPIQQALDEGKLRQDLYYRLNVFSLVLPPLRDRREVIPSFVCHFLNKHSSPPRPEVSPLLLDKMMQYSWPGNLRELENFIRRLIILRNETTMLAELDRLAAHARPLPAPAPVALPPPATPVGLKDLKREAERKAIQSALETTNWRRKDAARILNISYKALLYKMRELRVGAAEY